MFGCVFPPRRSSVPHRGFRTGARYGALQFLGPPQFSAARPATGRPGGPHAGAEFGASGLLSLSGHSEVFRGVASRVGSGLGYCYEMRGSFKLGAPAFVAKSGTFTLLRPRVVRGAPGDWRRGGWRAGGLVAV